MKKYEALATCIIKNVGGKENISSLTHCMTRLRFVLKDESLVNDTELKEQADIYTVNYAGGQVQVVVGNKVDDVFDTIMNQIGLTAKSETEETEKMSPLNRFIDIITKTITPILGLLCASGLIKGLLAILGVAHVLSDTSGTYIILNALGDACFYFMPVLLGYTSAQTFGLNKNIGAILGCLLVYPNLMADLSGGAAAYTFFANTPLQIVSSSTFLHIPVFFPENGYASTVIPIILLTWFAAKVEKWIKTWMPEAIGFAFTPFLTMLVSGSLGLLLIGPATDILSNCIAWGTTALYEFSPVITTFVVALVYQPLVIFGLHWPLLTMGIQNLATLGYDYIWPMLFTASYAQTAVVIAVMLRTKNKTVKASAVPAILSGCMCIIEPAIYGFTLPEKRRFGISCFAAAVGAVIMTVFHCTVYGFGVGIFEFPLYIKPDGSMQGMFMTLTAALVTMVIAFVLTFVTFREAGETKSEQAASESADTFPAENGSKEIRKPEFLGVPVEGKTVDVATLADPTFSEEILGKTFAFDPQSGKVVAPCDGLVSAVFPTQHAIGLTTEEGLEILLHIGINTVEMNGQGFVGKVKVQDTVKKGDTLVEFDKEAIVKSGYSPEVLMIITNSHVLDDVNVKPNQYMRLLDNLMEA